MPDLRQVSVLTGACSSVGRAAALAFDREGAWLLLSRARRAG